MFKSTFEEGRAAPTSSPATPNGARSRLPARLEVRFVDFARRHAGRLARLCLSVTFLLFGGLKIAGLSDVDELVGQGLPFLPQRLAVMGMGVVEVGIGLGLASGRFPRTTLALFFSLLVGTFSLLAHPGIALMDHPLRLTLAASYIIKNLTLIAAGVVIVASVPPGAKRLPPVWRAQDQRDDL